MNRTSVAVMVIASLLASCRPNDAHPVGWWVLDRASGMRTLRAVRDRTDDEAAGAAATQTETAYETKRDFLLSASGSLTFGADGHFDVRIVTTDSVVRASGQWVRRDDLITCTSEESSHLLLRTFVLRVQHVGGGEEDGEGTPILMLLGSSESTLAPLIFRRGVL